jgi:D-sedoheptulose 7-phosphate isomerase
MAATDPTFWRRALEARADTLRRVAAGGLDDELEELVRRVCATFGRDGRVLLFGNGGSAATAQHMAAELVGRFRRTRGPLRAIAITTDTSVLTAIANDFGFERVFERQIDALARPGDLAIGLSTSGASENVVRGIRAAKRRGSDTVALVGRVAGRVGRAADLTIRVPLTDVPVIQEIHDCLLHLVCERVDVRRPNPDRPARRGVAPR